jgi:hypothetical protein
VRAIIIQQSQGLCDVERFVSKSNTKLKELNLQGTFDQFVHISFGKTLTSGQ